MIARFRSCEVDLDRVELRRAHQLVPVEPQVFDVLSYLIEHRDRMVTKEELLDNVWGDRFVSESALTSRIKSARQAVGDNGREQAVIKTVHGRGYRFVAPVEFASTARSDSGSDSDDSMTDAAVGTTANLASTVVGQTGGTDAPELDDRWPLVGRRNHLELLHDVFDSRQHAGVLLTGAAGIGKTRLAREFVGQADAAGIPTIYLSGQAESADFPLAAVSHLLPPDVLAAGAEAGDLASAIVFQRARAAFAEIGGGDRPIALVDDVAHLDELTVALLGSLLAADTIFAVMTQRTAPGDTLSLDELVRSGRILHAELPPIDSNDLDVLLYRVLTGPIDLQSLERLTHLAHGRPGALQQLVESSRAAGSLQRHDGVWRLLGPLHAEFGPPGSERVTIGELAGAELAGAELLAIADQLPLEIASNLVGADVLDTLDRAGLLALNEAPSGPRVSIAHSHVASMLLDAVGPLRSRRQKSRLVAALGENAGELGTDDRLRAVRWSIEIGAEPPRDDVIAAATHSLAIVDTATCEVLLDHLDRCAPGSDATRLRAELAFRVGQFDTAERLLDELIGSDLDADEAAVVNRRRATIRFHVHGRFDEALKLLEPAGADRGEPLLTAHAIGLRGFLGYADDVRALAARLPAELPEAPELEVLRGRAMAAVVAGAYTDALQLTDEHRTRLAAVDVGPAQPAIEVELATRVDALVGRGDLSAALDLLREQLPVGQRTMLAWLPLAGGRAHLAADRPRAAREVIAAPYAAVRSQGVVHAEPLMSALLAQAAARLGDGDTARAHLDEAEQALPTLAGNLRWRLAASTADAWIDLGNRGRAIEIALGPVDDAVAHGAAAAAAELLTTAAVAGGTATHDSIVGRVGDLAGSLDGPLWSLRARHVTALANRSASDVLVRIAGEYRELGYERLAAQTESAVATA